MSIARHRLLDGYVRTVERLNQLLENPHVVSPLDLELALDNGPDEVPRSFLGREVRDVKDGYMYVNRDMLKVRRKQVWVPAVGGLRELVLESFGNTVGRIRSVNQSVQLRYKSRDEEGHFRNLWIPFQRRIGRSHYAGGVRSRQERRKTAPPTHCNS